MTKSKIRKQKKHPRTRAILELIGLTLLVAFSISQWATISRAIEEIRYSDPLFLTLAFIVYWASLPLTPISYQILSTKKISIWTNSLAQLAGSGPGRIIPGGLGRLSLAVIHLHKLGIETSRSIIISVTSNIIGVTVTVSTVLFLSLTNENASKFINGYNLLSTMLVFGLLILTTVMIGIWLLRTKKTRSTVLKLNSQWKSQIVDLLRHPTKLFKLIGIASLILIANSLILLLCAYALQINISFSDALIALSAGVFVAGLIPTPGGVGAVEAGIAGLLIAFGYSAYESTSIALLYRAITYIQPLIPGIMAYVYLRKRNLL